MAPLPPPPGTSSKNSSLCKQGHRKASTLICYQFSFSSSATWLEWQPGGGSWPGSSPFLLYLFSLISSSSPGAWAPRGHCSPPAGEGRRSYLNNPSQGQVSDCLCWGGSLLPLFFPPSSLRMGSQMCLSCRRRWGGAVGSCLKIAKGYGVSMGS